MPTETGLLASVAADVARLNDAELLGLRARAREQTQHFAPDSSPAWVLRQYLAHALREMVHRGLLRP